MPEVKDGIASQPEIRPAGEMNPLLKMLAGAEMEALRITSAGGEFTAEQMEQQKELEALIKSIALSVMAEKFSGFMWAALPEPLSGLCRNIYDELLTEQTPLVAKMKPKGTYWGAENKGVGGQWSGVAMLFYGEERITIDISNPKLILGAYLCLWTGIGESPEKTADGGIRWAGYRWSWSDAVPVAPYLYWHVADIIPDENRVEDGPTHMLNNHTCGDIKAPVPIPSEKYMVVQQGDGVTAGDKGLVGKYTRAH